MSVFDPKQLIAAQKTTAATLFALTNRVFEDFQRLTELNTKAVRSVLAESEVYWRDAWSCKTPEEFLAWQANLMQAATEQAISYSRQLAAITSEPHAEWVKAVGIQCKQYASTAQSLVENVARNAPAGTEIAATMMKSAFSTASSAGETVRKAAEQAIEAAKSVHAAKQ